MKKEKYYYSRPLYKANATVIVNARNQVENVNCISNYKPFPRLTICGIYDNEEHTMTYGIALCSERDTFRRKIGQKISYKRAFIKPYRVVNIKPEDKISDLFIRNARNIESEILGSNV